MARDLKNSRESLRLAVIVSPPFFQTAPYTQTAHHMNYKDDMNYKDESLGQLPILWKRFDVLYFFVRIFLNLCTQYPVPGERPLLAPFPALHPTVGHTTAENFYRRFSSPTPFRRGAVALSVHLLHCFCFEYTLLLHHPLLCCCRNNSALASLCAGTRPIASSTLCNDAVDASTLM